VIALEQCRIERSVNGNVEIVTASVSERAFPDRVSTTLGLCLKRGPEHTVKADGRKVVYPRDSLCIRTPGCVWSAQTTGSVAFVSVDLEASLLPDPGVGGPMRFVDPATLPDFHELVATLRSDAPLLQQETSIADFVELLAECELLRAPELSAGAAPRAAERARELLEAHAAAPPSLGELAARVGANRFVLLRQFRKRFGLPPHAFVLRLRADRARALLSRGADLVEVAYELGFSDQSHLNRLFKRIYGVTPAAYRRRSISFKRRVESAR